MAIHFSIPQILIITEGAIFAAAFVICCFLPPGSRYEGRRWPIVIAAGVAGVGGLFNLALALDQGSTTRFDLVSIQWARWVGYAVMGVLWAFLTAKHQWADKTQTWAQAGLFATQGVLLVFADLSSGIHAMWAWTAISWFVIVCQIGLYAMMPRRNWTLYGVGGIAALRVIYSVMLLVGAAGYAKVNYKFETVSYFVIDFVLFVVAGAGLLYTHTHKPEGVKANDKLARGYLPMTLNGTVPQIIPEGPNMGLYLNNQGYGVIQAGIHAE